MQLMTYEIMKTLPLNKFHKLDTNTPIWNYVFTVAPLVVIGSKENEGYDLAPKHMATPIGFDNYFGFVCTPDHGTYRNIKKTKEFTVSFPISNSIVLTSLTATARCDDMSKSKSIVEAIPTLKATTVDALFVADSYLYLECKLFKIIDGFNKNSLITGKIEAAFVDNNYLKSSEKDEQKQLNDHSLLAYIANGRFAEITKTFNFPYPKNFKR